MPARSTTTANPAIRATADNRGDRTGAGMGVVDEVTSCRAAGSGPLGVGLGGARAASGLAVDSPCDRCAGPGDGPKALDTGAVDEGVGAASGSGSRAPMK